MVRRMSPNPPFAEQQQQQQHQRLQDPIPFYDFDSCFTDGFSDFDPIKEWLIDPDQNPMPDSDIITGHLDGFGSENVETAHQDSILEASLGDKMEKVSLAASEMEPEGAGGENREVLEAKVEVGDEISDVIIAESKKGEISGATDKSTDAVSGVFSVEDPIKALDASDKEEISDESEDESEDSSSESSSSSSSSEEEESGNIDNEDVKEAMAAVEVEEGEIKADDLDELILGSDGEEEVAKGPIKSKHEIEDLPPVPLLEVSLEPHHQTLPVGFVSSILGNRVIVEGSEKHSPLNEGSILWMTETKFPLGIVDEIFGPVKNPYYIVRYNSDKEIPPGTCIGVAVSFVADFANHILNEKSLYQKGYDASGIDDEEVMDEVEFSDDEKEAEYRRSLRQNKRDASHGNQESGFSKKKNSFKGAGSHRNKQIRPPHSLPGRPMDQSRPPNRNAAHEPANLDAVAPLPNAVPAFPSQPQAFSMGVSSALGNTVQQFNSGPMQGFLAQPQPIGMQGGTFRPQPQLMGIQGGFPPPPQPMMMQGGGPPLNWLPGQQFGDQTCNLQRQAQFFNNFASGVMPYQQQQFLPYVGAIPGNFPWVAGLANPSIDPSSALAGLMGQGGFGQVMFGCGNMNPQPQGSSCVSNGHSQGQAPPAANQGEMRPSSMHSNRGQPNRGRSSSRGRTPYQRGRHHSFGRGGGNQHNA